MPKALDAIVNGESEAERIKSEAIAEAQKIRKEAEAWAHRTYTDAYEQAIAKAEEEAIELKKSARENADCEAKLILKEAKKQIEVIRAKAKNNFEAAVKAALSEFYFK